MIKRILLCLPLLALVAVGLFVPIVKAQSPAGAILLDWISGTIRDPGTGAVAPVSATLGLATHAPDGLSVTASVSSAATLFSTDTTGYQSVSVAVTSPGVGTTISYQVSNDNVNWVAAIGNSITNTGNATPFSATNAAGLYVFPTPARYFRAVVTTYGSGTATAVAFFRSAPNQSPGVNVGGGFVSFQGAISTGNTGTRLISAATTNATVAKASAGNLTGLVLGNNGAAAAYLHLYNLATSPTCGTSVPVATFVVPGATTGGTFQWMLDIGMNMSAGIAFCITGGMADTDTTAVALSQVSALLLYK
jgi:hypothetical protein